MNIDTVRNYCLSLPHATEDIQWGSDLLFRIAGKIFTVVNLEPPHQLSLKCTPEEFEQLVELDGILPAPYMARNKWVMLERMNALSDPEIKSLIKKSYDMIFAKLPRKTQAELSPTKLPAVRKRRAGRGR